jgi:hypothetical protein
MLVSSSCGQDAISLDRVLGGCDAVAAAKIGPSGRAECAFNDGNSFWKWGTTAATANGCGATAAALVALIGEFDGPLGSASASAFAFGSGASFGHNHDSDGPSAGLACFGFEYIHTPASAQCSCDETAKLTNRGLLLFTDG